MRVLHLLKTSVGASWALRQTRELVRAGIEVHLAIPHGPMVEKYRQAGVHVHIFDPALDIVRPWRNIAKGRQLRALVKKINPDIIHSHFVATTLLMRVALRRIAIPRIFHVPGPLHLEHRLFRAMDLYSAQSSDYWLASCKWTQQHYRQSGITPARVGLAYYGVDEGDFSFIDNPASTLKQELGMGPDDPLIGMVAYFYAPKRYLGQSRGLKGHEDLIDALAIVKQRIPGVKCVFVGGPWGNAQHYFEQVQAYARHKVGDACVFLGLRHDVPALYPQFDLAVHPSHSENVGGAVESMYARIPTITTNVGGFPDLVIEGETGYLARVQDPKDLADKIIQALTHSEQCQAMVEKAHERVREVMNVKHNAQEVLSYYRQVLGQQENVA